jgi:alkylation response protein AidB-like acyl-CoA dehydrogenase
LIRDGLVRQWMKVQLIKFGNQRLLFDALNGTQQADTLRATTKLWWSRTHQDTLDLAMDLLGPDGQVLTGDPAREGDWIPGVGLRHGRPDYPASALQRAFLFSRSDTIGGGTSEIQLGIIAERVLKLPRAR